MTDVVKKRKRISSGIDVPNKKTAQTQRVAPLVNGSATEHALPPVIAVSQGIIPPPVLFAAYTKSTSTILHSSKHPRLDFTALPKADDLAHYIGIVDGSELRIIPAHRTQLQCVLRTESVEDTPRKSLATQRVALGQEFGTKKAKKAIASRTVNAITSAPAGTKNDVQNAVLEDVAEQTGKEEIVELATQLAAKPIPKPNLEARTVEEVYPLTSLISVGDGRLLSIKDWQEKARVDENNPQPHRFTAYRVSSLGKTNDISRLKALRYAGLLLQFHDTLVKYGKSGKKVPKDLSEKLKDFPEALVDSIRRKFSNEKNELGKWHLENLHTHICALSLLVDDWNTDTSNIRDDLKLDQRTISQYFTELGCKIGSMTEKERTDKQFNKAQAKSVKMARLKLPLEFPKLKTGIRK